MNTIHSGNGAFNHLIEQLDARLARIEHAIDRLSDEHATRHREIHARVNILELHKAEAAGSWRTLTLISGVVASVVSIASGYIVKFFNYG